MTDYWDYYNDTYTGGGGDGGGSSPLPNSWKIAPLAVLNGDPEAIAKCPKESATFIAFAITNAVMTILGTIMGYRPFLNKLTCGCFGKKEKYNTIRYNWIPPLALHASANALNAAIIHGTPGYENVRVQDAMMIYFVRPRISVLVLATMTAFFVTRNDYPWMHALIGNTVAELILQVIADIWVIATGIGGWNTTAMGIAVAMCISTGLFFITTIIIVIATRPFDLTGEQVFNSEYAAGFRVSNSFCNRFKNWFFLMLFGAPAYLISWGFFINLITTAKSDWCPPKLAAQVTVWVFLPLLGTICGVGVS